MILSIIMGISYGSSIGSQNYYMIEKVHVSKKIETKINIKVLFETVKIYNYEANHQLNYKIL